MPIAADFGDNRIVNPNDLVVQLRFAINRGWEPDMSSNVSSEEEDIPRESEIEGHEDSQNHEVNRPSSPKNDEQTTIDKTPNPIPRANKNPRKRKKVDPYEGADPRAKRPSDFPVRAGPPQRPPNIPPKPEKSKKTRKENTEDEQNWLANEEIESSGCERVRTRAQKRTNLEASKKRKQTQSTIASTKEKGKQNVVSSDDMSNLPKPHSTTFLSQESGKLWKRSVEKKIINQKLLVTDKLDNLEQIQEVLISNQLLRTVTNIEPYDEEVIQEFYCNLTKTTTIPSSSIYLGTPETEQQIEINSEQVAKELIAGNVSFEKNKIKAASLTSKYAILQKIALANWIPSLHESTVKWTLAELLYKIGKGLKINMGAIIHTQVTNLAEDTKSNTSLISPNLIFAILTKQGLKTQGPKTTVKNINTTLRLRKGNHQNVLKSSAPKNNPLDSKTLINYFESRLTELEALEKQLLRKQLNIKEEKAEIIEWLAILKEENKEDQEQGTEEDFQEAENEEDQEQNQGTEEDIQEHSQEKSVETPVTTSDSEVRG
ncbi:PREDICTED: uncharacterized protein LOC109192002 [Ipomoea nil]|uniref:uncharacterized protein LOC109192002 n=1 Tax=Ipomoea nil TaxID=35883 RepID=UPI00090160B5|nr:PREDICTED: uncharacterized protein LOC109192002 [Ipomoea nil]